MASAKDGKWREVATLHVPIVEVRPNLVQGVRVVSKSVTVGVRNSTYTIVWDKEEFTLRMRWCTERFTNNSCMRLPSVWVMNG